ncbi:MAG: hypothetical protein HQ552_03210, partial [Desulfobacteraceae bacterium]|nr:hypothetical protein [Desulfobacteraceae bacterium]
MKRRCLTITIMFFCFLWTVNGIAINVNDIPHSHTNIFLDQNKKIYIKDKKQNRYDLKPEEPQYTLRMVRGNPTGSATGIAFNFHDPDYGITLERGTLYYGFINHG